MLILLPTVVLAIFWLVDRNVADGDPADPLPNSSEPDLVKRQLAAAERLRREAAATVDAAEKASLTRLADEADADAVKLQNDSD